MPSAGSPISRPCSIKCRSRSIRRAKGSVRPSRIWKWRASAWRRSSGELRVLVTTARAILEKTRMPRALQDLRVELRKGEMHRLSELAQHLESIGFERVSMVEDVAQFSIRGGIFDVYSFGMAEPVRAEFWGNEIVDLRHFDLATQRSSRAVDFALVLPVDGHVREDVGDSERGSIAT